MIKEILILAAASGSIPNLPVVDPILLNKIKIYDQCLYEKSIALERSDASIDDIFLASTEHCADSWSEIYIIQSEQFKGSPRELSGTDSGVIAIEFLDSLNARSKRKIRLRLLEIRANRK